MRSIFSLPARLGGLGIQVPMLEASFEYECSVKMTAHLAEAIYRQDGPFKAIGGLWSKKHVKLILKNSLLWFQRFLPNVKIQLHSEDMTKSIFGVLTFI